MISSIFNRNHNPSPNQQAETSTSSLTSLFNLTTSNTSSGTGARRAYLVRRGTDDQITEYLDLDSWKTSHPIALSRVIACFKGKKPDLDLSD